MDGMFDVIDQFPSYRGRNQKILQAMFGRIEHTIFVNIQVPEPFADFIDKTQGMIRFRFYEIISLSFGVVDDRYICKVTLIDEANVKFNDMPGMLADG